MLRRSLLLFAALAVAAGVLVHYTTADLTCSNCDQCQSRCDDDCGSLADCSLEDCFCALGSCGGSYKCKLNGGGIALVIFGVLAGIGCCVWCCRMCRRRSNPPAQYATLPNQGGYVAPQTQPQYAQQPQYGQQTQFVPQPQAGYNPQYAQQPSPVVYGQQ